MATSRPDTGRPPSSIGNNGFGSKTELQGHDLTSGATTDHERIFVPYLPKPEQARTGYPFPSGANTENQLPTESEPQPSAWQSSQNSAQVAIETPSTAQWYIIPARKGNDGLQNAIRSATEDSYLDDTMWVGTLGMSTDAHGYLNLAAITRKMKDEYGSLTVLVSDRDFDGHYTHFCKTILWPIFHYQVPDNPKSKAYEDHSWAYYVNLNQAFADCIAQNWKRGDSIWVQDYHLMLVPAMLRKILPDARIGFFLHTAFPSSEVFRCLASRKELLEGILGSDLIGFQTDEYCCHFLRTCSRILFVEATNEGIYMEDRFVNVGTFPIGINPISWDYRRQLADVRQWIDIISARYQGKRLIVSRDKMDSVAGIRQKLLGYELFLNTYSEWVNRVVLIQVATSTIQQPELEASISDIIMRINSTHATLDHQPLVFLKQDPVFPQYLALITASDAMMITSLREGMNLTSHEFIYCQDGLYGNEGYGSLILSEFTGSASIFGDSALLVNPWDTRQCANAINTALRRTKKERKQKWEQLHRSVLQSSAINWVKSFKVTMNRVCDEQSSRKRINLPLLSIDRLEEPYRQSCRRLIFIDYGDTLAPWASLRVISYTPPERTIKTLTELTEDPANTVYVMSPRMPEEMDRHFSHLGGVALIAENGCFLREPHAVGWTKLVKQPIIGKWKDGVFHILTYFQERMDGSWIEERHCSLVFHYGSVEDRIMAERLAAECADQINDSCIDQGIHAIALGGALKIETVSTNKGLAADAVWRCWERIDKDGNIPRTGFLLIISGNSGDECLFRWANQLESSKAIGYAMTVALDTRSTEAKAMLTQGATGGFDSFCKRRLSTKLYRCC